MSELQPIHAAPTSFIKKHIFSTDHKVIAKQFLWAGLLFLALGGFLAMLIRWQWAFPGEAVPFVGQGMFPSSDGSITPSGYTKLFTNHGLIMIFFAITPLLIGFFGNLLIPLQIGARDMAFPRLNMASFWVFVLSQLLVLASLVVPLGAAAAGWTTYPPLSTNIATPGLGQTLMVMALFVVGISTIMGAINYIVTIIGFRAPGMGYFKMPLSIWGLWLASILNLLFVPVLGSAGLLLLFDRLFDTQFFIAGASGNGDPILFQHLFWLFGHPEVYILILPAWGVIADFLSFFSRKPSYFYKGSVWALVTISILSALVYGHHMFVAGMSPMLGKSFMLLTLAISIPAELLFLNWLHTIWKGSIRLTVPMLFSLGFVFVFALGGLTGIHLGTISTDLYLHDTMFVVGHFHFTLAAATFLAVFAGIYFWFPKMFGRHMNQRLGKIHFWTSFIGINGVFTGQLIVGYAGQHRRLYDPYEYTFIKHLQPLNEWTTYFAFFLGVSSLVFVVNFFWNVFRRGHDENIDNPWEVGTLEWTVPSPPHHHNFDTIPTVFHGPHEYSNPEVKKALGKDWLAQTEKFSFSKQDDS